jgi:serine/threonine protein kinase
MLFDGYKIIRVVRGSSRSHVYLAVDVETDSVVIIKTPSIDLQGDPAYLERFLMEEWVARRINSPHVLKPCMQAMFEARMLEFASQVTSSRASGRCRDDK